MRSKYIRFFISSTFADMAIERDLLQKLFKKLGDEYKEKGWQVEAVDLRWGISQEAGYDNRTIRICKNEIKRCQEMSPKPNFISLVGDRYGWTPLPETIPQADYQLLKMTDEEKLLFHTWYRLDENILPQGEYVLQRREDKFRDNNIWFDEVEQPLSKVFTRNSKPEKKGMLGMFKKNDPAFSLFGDSATAQEIKMGAFELPDAKKHVIAYLRDLSDVPPEEAVKFCEPGFKTSLKISYLKGKLLGALNRDNILKYKTTFSNYQSQEFADFFTVEMERRIRRVIDDAITEYDAQDATENNDIHLAIAEETAKGFVGREKELEEIDRYISNEEERRPLWIKGDSGSGKSALLAKIIQTHKESHNIICRFCGKAPGASTPYEIFSSFPNDIGKLTQKGQYKLRDLSKPTLIVIDALNQLDDSHYHSLASLNWLNREIPPKIKIIISSTNELKFNHTPSFVNVYNLPDMGKDSEALVMDIITGAGRTLTAKQKDSLKRIIANSNKSAIYLHILGHYLKNKPSWEQLDNTPEDLHNLVNMMTEEILKPENHGGLLVGEVVSFLLLDKTGFTDNEVIDLLSESKYLKDELKHRSFHDIDTDNPDYRLPSVIWSRLRYDLEPFLRTYNSRVGQVTTFYHDEIKDIFFKIAFSSGNSILCNMMAQRLFQYYHKKIKEGDPHALLEIINSTIDPKRDKSKKVDHFNRITELLLKDPYYIFNKYQKFPDEIVKDFNTVEAYLPSDRRMELEAMKRAILSVPKVGEVDQKLGYSLLLPQSSPLHQLALKWFANKENLLSNAISDAWFKDSTVYAVGNVGENPLMSEDGTRVVSLFDNRRRIFIEDARNPEKSKSINSSNQIREMSGDDNLSYLLLRFEGFCDLLDTDTLRTIFSFNLDETDSVCMSADARIIAVAQKDKVIVFVKDSDEKGYKPQITVSYDIREVFVVAVGLDYTGQYLWILKSNKDVESIDIKSQKFEVRSTLHMFEPDGNQYYLTGGSDKEIDFLDSFDGEIQSCTKNWCILRYKQFYYIIYNKENNQGISVWYKRHETQINKFTGDLLKPRKLIDRDERFICSYSGVWFDESFHIDEIVHADGNLYFRSVRHSLVKGLRCVNSDFSLGLNAEENRIISMPVQLIKFPYDHISGNKLVAKGINCLSCDSSGNLAYISYGYGRGEVRHDVSIIKNNKIRVWIPPFQNFEHENVRLAVSPNAAYVVVAQNYGLFSQANSQILIVPIDGGIIKTFNLPNGIVEGISVSQDSNYFFLFHLETYDKKNRTGFTATYTKDGKWVAATKGNMNVNVNSFKTEFDATNRYGLLSPIDDMKGYLLVDNIKPETSFKSRLINLHIYGGFEVPLHVIGGDGFIYSNEEVGSYSNLSFGLIRINLETKAYEQFNIDKFVCGVSPTGRFLYFIDRNYDYVLKDNTDDGIPELINDKDGKLIYIYRKFEPSSTLYISQLPFHEEFTPIVTNVKFIIPALDEAHIYIVAENWNLLLYNIFTREIEQIAFCGIITKWKVCARGIYVYTADGDLFFFEPAPKHRVNVPAATSFVRRWNLETKTKENPTAVCPMCGYQFDMPDTLSNVIQERPEVINPCDWDNPLLKGHRCPHCNAELQYNPYIIET